MSILKKNKKSHLTKTMFLDEGVDIARYDHIRHSVIDKITEKQKCSLCGCYMPTKAGWKTSECPDTPKKWEKLHLSKAEQMKREYKE